MHCKRLVCQSILYLPTGKRRTALNFLGAVRWLRRLLREFQPDVVQSMLFHANLLAALATDRTAPSSLAVFVFGNQSGREVASAMGFASDAARCLR